LGDQLGNLGGEGHENRSVNPLGEGLRGGKQVANHVVVMLAVNGDHTPVPYDVCILGKPQTETQHQISLNSFLVGESLGGKAPMAPSSVFKVALLSRMEAFTL